MRTAPHGFLRVGAATPRLQVADPEFNLKEILAQLAAARERGCQVLVFPELALCGYTSGDLFFSLSTLVAASARALDALLRATVSHATVVVVGLPVFVDGRLFNCAA